MKPADLKKYFDAFEDKMDDIALLARQSGTPSHVLIEIKNDIKGLVEKIDSIELQTTKTNGRVTRLEKTVLIVGTALAVLGVVKYPVLLGLLNAL